MLLRSPFDTKRFKNKHDLEKYVEENYKDQIPEEFNGDVAHFLYVYRNGRGKCQICGAKTLWNPVKKRYDILCRYPDTKNMNEVEQTQAGLSYLMSFINNKGNTCEQVMRKQYLENIKKVHNTDNLAKDPEYQKYVLNHRKIADVVQYNGKEYTVIGSYEKKFVETLDKSKYKYELKMPGDTIHIKGNYDMELDYTIPDAFIPELNLFISIKDIGTNPNFIKNYKKSCIIFHYVITRTPYRMIELNGLDQVKNILMILDRIKYGEFTMEEAAPIFMKRMYPELYEEVLKINKF